jgi:HK97 family phage portal protein
METAEQREARIKRLEEARAARAGAAAPTGPVEVAPGRGDLRRTSVPVAPVGPVLPLPWIPQGGLDFMRTVDGRHVSFAHVFATQQWVAAAVMRMLTWSVRVPLKCYQRTGDDSRLRLRAGDHPVAAALASPAPGSFPARLTMDLLGPFLVHGNSTTEVDEGARGQIMFEAHDWRKTSALSLDANDPTSPIVGWQVWDSMGNVTRTISADAMIHAAWWSPLGPLGISPLQQLGATLRIEDAAMRYQQAQLRNGARPPSAIEATTEFLGLERSVRDALLEQLREDVTLLYSGPENQGRPALLPPGLQWKPVGHTSVEAELIEQRYISREEIAAVYQIPPPSLGDLRRATYSNIVELRQVAYTDGLGPPLVVIEQLLTSCFQNLLREMDLYVEFDFAGVLRGDFLKEVNALRSAIASGLMTPNEGRATINRPASDEPDADKLWMPFNNLWPMGTVPPANRQTRRQQQEQGAGGNAWREDEPRRHATAFIVAEHWRTHVDRERAAEYAAAAEIDRPEPPKQAPNEAHIKGDSLLKDLEAQFAAPAYDDEAEEATT